ncbi:tyrosine-type recombinase/integrase [Lachnospiraceae bacterium 46-61]
MSEYLKKQMSDFYNYLILEEKEQSTIEKYLSEMQSFTLWLGERSITKRVIFEWKEHLCQCDYQANTINAKISVLNKFLCFIGIPEYKLKYLKIQKKLFCSTEKELKKEEYERLLKIAEQQGKTRLSLLIETICATGIRVSEVKYITIKAIQTGQANISLKGKIRTILLPNKLCRKLIKYAKKQNITSGEIFLTRNHKVISRRQIWAEMKALCEKANVAHSKVFPHNLRHLFARTFYRACKDISKLADVLGHSNINTTRIYLISTGIEHKEKMEKLGLIV